jgi:hypothetical protein
MIKTKCFGGRKPKGLNMVHRMREENLSFNNNIIYISCADLLNNIYISCVDLLNNIYISCVDLLNNIYISCVDLLNNIYISGNIYIQILDEKL